MHSESLDERITRSLAYMLRHQPEEFDLELDRYGYGDLDEVVQALQERLGDPVDAEDVRQAITNGDRKRYEIQGTRIRALYGHSFTIDPGEPSEPPEQLYLGVGSRDAARAETHGLRSGRRAFLHLALTYADAVEAGRRAARDYAVITVHALDAFEDGIDFYDRGALFLAEELPREFLEVGDICHDGIERRGERGGDRGGRDDRGGRGGRDDRGARGGRDDRGPRGGRDDRGPRGDRDTRGPRGDREDRGPRDERGGGRERDHGRPSDSDRDRGRDAGERGGAHRPPNTDHRPAARHEERPTARHEERSPARHEERPQPRRDERPAPRRDERPAPRRDERDAPRRDEARREDTPRPTPPAPRAEPPAAAPRAATPPKPATPAPEPAGGSGFGLGIFGGGAEPAHDEGARRGKGRKPTAAATSGDDEDAPREARRPAPRGKGRAETPPSETEAREAPESKRGGRGKDEAAGGFGSGLL